MKGRCITGCQRKAVQQHHVVYVQELRRWPTDSWVTEMSVQKDKRNLVPVCHKCHQRHHQAVERIALARLPDSVFEFATELMGTGPAYEFLRRRYAGEDARLDALLEGERA